MVPKGRSPAETQKLLKRPRRGGARPAARLAQGHARDGAPPLRREARLARGRAVHDGARRDHGPGGHAAALRDAGRPRQGDLPPTAAPRRGVPEDWSRTRVSERDTHPGPDRLHPRDRGRRRARREAQDRRHPLPARAERLPAHRPRQVDLPQLRHRRRVRRPLPPALRRHQPHQGGAGVHRRDRGGRALAGLRLGRAPLLRLRLLRAALRLGARS